MALLEYEDEVLPCAGGAKRGSFLFLHGFTGTYADNFSARGLSRSFDYYALNLPGHRSVKEERFCGGLEDYAAYVAGYIERKDLRGLTLSGHSMGGAVAALVEERARGRLSSLILINPLARSIKGVSGLEKILFPRTLDDVFALCRYAYHDFESMKEADGFKDACLKTLEFQLERRIYFRGLYEAMTAEETIAAVEAAVRAVQTKTLYITGRHDKIVPNEAGEMPPCAAENKYITPLVFENSGHCPHNEESAAFIRRVLDFV
jgi:pimeloyl-ACP methyl ester carboxylesterase